MGPFSRPASGQNVTNEAPRIYAALTVDREHIYTREPFTLTLSIYSNYKLDNRFSVTDFPSESLLERGQFEELAFIHRHETAAGTHDIRRFVCEVRALKPGTIILAPEISGLQTELRRSFRGTIQVQTPFSTKVQPLKLEIRDVPSQNRPMNWSGALGRLRMESSVSTNILSPGDVVTISTTITGKGFLEDARPPEVSVQKAFKVYLPQEQQEKATDDSRTFTQDLIPLNTNSTQIGAVQFVFFNTDSEKFETLSQGPFSLSFIERSGPEIDSSITKTIRSHSKIDIKADWDMMPDEGQWLQTERAIPINTSQMFLEASKAYSDGHYPLALKAFKQIGDAGWYSKALYFNIGNVYLQSGHIGHALSFYMRAHQLDPFDSRIKTNINAARFAAGDPPLNQPFGEDILGGCSTSTWLKILAASTILALLTLVMNHRLNGHWASKTLGGGFCLAILLSSSGIVYHFYKSDHIDAIVTRQSAALFAPSADSEALTLLHDGNSVEVLESWQDWCRVQHDGQVAWIQANALAVVSPDDK
jgi:hypothetical protein